MRAIIKDVLHKWEERLNQLDAEDFESAADNEFSLDRRFYSNK
jgi:hypothetical protein